MSELFADKLERCLKELEMEAEAEFGRDDTGPTDKRNVSQRCIKHLGNWMRSNCSQGLVDDRRRTKKECYKQVRREVTQEYQEEYGFAILSFLLIYVVLPMVLKWLIEKIFKKLAD